ncbi:MAG: hypothetical protein ABUS48_06340 [Pseudomonadota bacterium]
MTLVFVAAPAFAEPLAVDSPRWTFEGDEHRVVEFQGKHALWLKGSVAELMDANFDTGVIEFDMAIPTTDPSFPGIIFRGQGEGDYENFYVRPHQNGHPDSTQYTPYLNGMSAWQIFSGENFESQTMLPINQWFHFKMEIAADSARVYINSDTPTLVIHDLKREERAGFQALKGSSGGAYYANISITPSSPEAASPEQPPEGQPAGIVRTWSVSPAMTEVAAMAAAASNHLDTLHWTPLPVEINGIAALSRVNERTTEGTTTLARVTVHADRARSTLMRFGFSDRVHIYLNGALLYAGDDTQYSRDYRFLGIVGFWDALQLPLKRGDNEIVFAVTEGEGGAGVGGGGWAALAAIPDMTGLTVSAR